MSFRRAMRNQLEAHQHLSNHFQVSRFRPGNWDKVEKRTAEKKGIPVTLKGSEGRREETSRSAGHSQVLRGTSLQLR